eukprot:CAMPEP_0201869098 /NCGR_PEP_ID=MMETSP0902-20130614/2742_1 /ASSEMBLY_ACC=CAM_ASM_000551 /TAXON_ID=420261 /ORGANISM="Thalassiosira antarctica, Strain CCMP982" /LENGTH=90 /DNA_ID=CAMNT_0048394545 /DNA_START=807 /DNA_END=1076 /DNA_ORIENTATION=-
MGKWLFSGAPAPVGCIEYVYNLKEEGVWVQKEKLVVPDGYYDPGLSLRSSVASSSGEDGMIVVGSTANQMERYFHIGRIFNTHIMDPAIE